MFQTSSSTINVSKKFEIFGIFHKPLHNLFHKITFIYALSVIFGIDWLAANSTAGTTSPRGECVENKMGRLARRGFFFCKHRIQERSESLDELPVIPIAKILPSSCSWTEGRIMTSLFSITSSPRIHDRNWLVSKGDNCLITMIRSIKII